jgi:HTH-type transcriptional regulator/antitoxin HigA
MDNKWKVLKTEPEYKVALKRTIELFHADENTSEGEELDLLLLLVKDYEDRHYHIPDPDPIEVIKLKLEEKGLKQKDLVHIIGSKVCIPGIIRQEGINLKNGKGIAPVFRNISRCAFSR